MVAVIGLDSGLLFGYTLLPGFAVFGDRRFLYFLSDGPVIRRQKLSAIVATMVCGFHALVPMGTDVTRPPAGLLQKTSSEF